MNKTSHNRRTLIKGAAWAAPVVAASATIPAYAASPNYSAYATQSQTADTTPYVNRYTWETVYYTTVTTAGSVDGELPGFTVGLTEPGLSAKVTLTKLEYYIALPAALDDGSASVENLSSAVGGAWSSPVRVYPSTLTYVETVNGRDKEREADVSNMHVYKMTFAGNTTNTVSADSPATWPATPVQLRFASSDTNAAQSQTYYGGYIASFEIKAGNKVFNNIPLIRKQVAKVKSKQYS